MQKEIANINLFYRPTVRDNKRQYCSNDNRLDCRVVSLIKIKFWLLMKTLGSKGCLVSVHTTICFSFDSENPNTTNNAHGRFARNKSPCSILQKSINLICHSITPH